MKNISDSVSTLRAAILLLLLAAGFTPIRATAQSVSHPESEITTAARHYAYAYRISPTQEKQIGYIIVRASTGEIKTVFNACDVCYRAEKGYSQSGTDLRCNNCGNRFAIDTLGGTNTAGTCHPGYLPHRLEGGMVVIDVADLIVGEYYFKAQTITSVQPAPAAAGEIALRGTRGTLTVTLPHDARREFFVYSLTGQLLFTHEDAARIVRIPIAGLHPGAYVLVVRENTAVTAKTFLVY